MGESVFLCFSFVSLKSGDEYPYSVWKCNKAISWRAYCVSWGNKEANGWNKNVLKTVEEAIFFVQLNLLYP